MQQPNVSKAKNVVSQLESVNGIVEQTFYYEQTVFDLNNKIARNKMQIKKFLGRKDSLSVKVNKDLEFLVKRETDIDLTFFPDKLQKALDKDRFDKVTDKKVVITDLEGLIKMLKENGIKPKEFKKFITTEHTVNVEKIDHLIEIEEISIDEIHGCYNADFEEEIKIRKIK